ncbi:hypothetical protein KO561_09385 [Radiobacillus kanasensis]|uniref:hypothetical protein n=1 Tax=Radiobacillus kanasensis TaxID=2844358 RepID=UPI001E3B39AB|nr:hypothetical protein [Radiobacillus kanasensis]UFU01125.1 hypothetical protein KO561_09385 [Radiobacillus kanasensis]
MKKKCPIYFDEIMISTMEDSASLNFGKNISKQNFNITKTNQISGQITGDHTTNDLLTIDSDLYNFG